MNVDPELMVTTPDGSVLISDGTGVSPAYAGAGVPEVSFFGVTRMVKVAVEPSQSGKLVTSPTVTI